MAFIRIVNLFDKNLEVNDFSKPLLRHFHGAGIDWMHACGGKGRCTTCKVIIESGQEHLEPETSAETRYRNMGALSANERLSCQTRIKGDVSVRAPDEYKLPHVRYSDE